MTTLELKNTGFCLALALASCASTGRFVWVDELPASTTSLGYVIAPGDTLNVRVFNQDAMSARAKVRADGQITLPFVNDVAAAGTTPGVLAQQLQTRLKDFINNPVVSVALEEARQLNVTVLGEVVKPGVYPLEPGAGLLPAIAAAGGLTDWASKDSIFVIRPGTPAWRIRFRFSALAHAEGRAGVFRLQSGDQIVVE